MSERADDDVRGEQRKAARQLKQQQQQLQRGEASTAMATVAERRSLPSPEIMLGQPWSNWVDAVKLHIIDGAEFEESLKECGKNREAMRLSRDDMPIFGQCPAQDDFYLVMCNHCSQVVKPQAFQAHYERRHSSASKPPLTFTSSSSSSYLLSSRSKEASGGVIGGSALGRPSSGSSASTNSSSSSSSSKVLKPAKEKLPQRRPPFPFKVLLDDGLTPAVKVEKMQRVDSSAKLTHVAPPASSSASSVTVSSSLKPGLNCSSIPKPPLLAPGQIPNGKGHFSSLDKKQDSSASRRYLYKRLSEREFNPDIHCGVQDMTARKPCTRSLTCKTHSLSQRRAVLGRRKRFDTLLAEHKSKARSKELQHRSEPPQQTPPLRDPHPSPARHPLQDPHQVSHGNGTADPPKPLALSKPKPHNPALPRLNSSSSHPGGNVQGDVAMAHETPHHPADAADGSTRLSSDEGENEDREEITEKLDCHYSAYHPRPAAFCAFGSRLFGRGCYSFDRRWDRVRSALNAMMDKHVNSQMWRKLPLVLENSSSASVHRTSTNSLSSSSSASSGFLSPSPAPPYGTTLNVRAPLPGTAEPPAYSAASRQVSSSPQLPSARPSAPSSLTSRAFKSRSSSKSFRVREPSSSSSSMASTNTATNTTTHTNSSGGSGGGSLNLSLGKKRKNSSLLSSHGGAYTSESPSALSLSTSSSSFKKNCAVNSGSSGSSYHASLSSANTSSSSSMSSSHSGVYSVGLNCAPGRTHSLSLRQADPTTRPPPASGSPAESIKRMSVVMNSSDSTLSLGPFVHQASDAHHAAFTEGKRRKGSPASGTPNSTGGGSAGGLGGGQGPGRPKVAKSPSINNIHSKHARSVPGAPGLPNNSLLHQPKARP